MQISGTPPAPASMPVKTLSKSVPLSLPHTFAGREATTPFPSPTRVLRNALPPQPHPISVLTPKASSTPTHRRRPSPCGVNKLLVPDKLGKLLPAINAQCVCKGFLPTCVSVRVRPDILPLVPDAHAAAPLLHYLVVQGTPVNTASDMSPKGRC